MLTTSNLLSTAAYLSWNYGQDVLKKSKNDGLVEKVARLIIPGLTALFSFEAANGLYPVIAGRVHLPTGGYPGILGKFVFGAFVAHFTINFVNDQITTAQNWSKGL